MFKKPAQPPDQEEIGYTQSFVLAKGFIAVDEFDAQPIFILLLFSDDRGFNLFDPMVIDFDKCHLLDLPFLCLEAARERVLDAACAQRAHRSGESAPTQTSAPSANCQIRAGIM